MAATFCWPGKVAPLEAEDAATTPVQVQLWRLRRPRVDWSRVRLPAKFSTARLSSAYLLSAPLPGLEAGNVRLRRKSGGVLSIQGLRPPSLAEQRALERSLAARVDRLPRERRQHLRQEDLDELAARLGRGSFGLLKQEFELPGDVDWECVECFYEEGVLRVILPRVATTARDLGGCDAPRRRRASQSRLRPASTQK